MSAESMHAGIPGWFTALCLGAVLAAALLASGAAEPLFVEVQTVTMDCNGNVMRTTPAVRQSK